MTMHIIALGGCRPTPLAHYLKALGVLRLIATQADQSARGAWRDGRFSLASNLDAAALLEFFLQRYSPTPVLSPWNGGSGFYPKDNTEGIAPIEAGAAERFAPYRSAIVMARRVVGPRDKRPDSGPDKNGMLADVLGTWSDDALAWFSSSVFLDDGGEPTYPALLGTGGNDGRLDFSSNYMRRLVELIDPETGLATSEARALLPNALFGTPTPNLPGGSIGQFNPGAAGGANAGAGFDGSPKWNPWDFVLMIEGAMVLRVAGLRKLEATVRAQAAVPFALRSTARGFGSATDEEDSGRGEQWLPLWEKLASFDEVRQLFGEARLRSGGRTADGALDAARALNTLGVARGVSAFVRYSYIVRNGLSNLAVPTGVFEVGHHPQVRLLDAIDDFASRIRRAGSESSTFQRLSRAIDTAMLECAQLPRDTQRWQSLVIALGEAEHAMLSRPKLVVDAHLRRLPDLSTDWLKQLGYEGSAEVRLAVAIATATDRELGSIHRHAIPLDKARGDLSKGTDALAHDADVIWSHRELTTDLLAVLARRLMASRGGLLPLASAIPAPVGDVAAFIEGRVDEAKVGRLARGLMTLNPEGDRPNVLMPNAAVPVALAVIRMVYPAHAVEQIDRHGTWHALRLLGAGQMDAGANALFRHLASRGLRSKLRVLAGSPEFARRLAASVAIPISAADHRRLWCLIARPDTSQPESDPS